MRKSLQLQASVPLECCELSPMGHAGHSLGGLENQGDAENVDNKNSVHEILGGKRAAPGTRLSGIHVPFWQRIWLLFAWVLSV